MIKRKDRTTKFSMGLLLVAVVALCLLPCKVKAQSSAEICGDPSLSDLDYDRDGFSNGQECEGLPLLNSTDFPGWDPNVARQLRLDPATPDLFVILVRATDLEGNHTNIPEYGDPGYFNPLEIVSKEIQDGGLGITTHLLPAEWHPERLVSPVSDQKAVKLTEYLNDPENLILGYAPQGTPNGLDDAEIYTERIVYHTLTVCAEEGSVSCSDAATGLTGQDLVNLRIQHTIAHEIGHMAKLAVEYDKRFDGYHYKAGSEVVMEQSILYSARKGVVQFFISKDYAAPSQASFFLK